MGNPNERIPDLLPTIPAVIIATVATLVIICKRRKVRKL